MAVLDTTTPSGFGLDQLALDDRLRLFHFVTGPERFLYLAILRVFDRARQGYQVQLTATDVTAGLEPGFGEDDVDVGTRVQNAVDNLTQWKLLHRSHDAGRVASIAEYRLRRSVYQMTELGFLAFNAVESVIRARPSDAELRRLAFPAILDDLKTLAEANRAGDAKKVNVLLDRLHGVLTQLSDRAARFYLMIGDLAQAHEARPELFLRHKDLLLSHLMDFLVELQRYRPLIAGAVADVAATGEMDMVKRAASADGGVFLSADEKQERWQSHWDGIRRWFVGAEGTASTAERLDGLTAHAISDLVSLLRRVMHGRRGGVSRESQLQFLARWFVDLASDNDAHALYGAAFGLRSARHLSLAYDDDEASTGRSWWTTPPVKVSATLREHGKTASPGRPGALRDNSRARSEALAQQKAGRAAELQAAARLAEGGLDTRVLEAEELDLLLRLLDVSLQTRSSGLTADGEQATLLAEAQLLDVRIRLWRDRLGMTIASTKGRLRAAELRIDLEAGTTNRRGGRGGG